MRYVILCTVLCFSFLTPSHAYWGETHERIAEETFLEREPLLNEKIKEIGLTSGVNELFGSGTSMLLLKNGSKTEDNGDRALNHFYNPMDGSGLRTYDVASSYSSFVWANEIHNGWSWGSARHNFYSGMTASSDTERRSALADSFRALGQVMHLVQDLGVPAHVRNDAHLPPSGDGFERYTNKNVDSLNFTPTAFSGSKDSLYFLPKQLWDSDQYDGTNPSFSTAIGLAEYTNANFASEDTIFTENNLTDWNPLNENLYFPYPRREDTVFFAESQNTTWNGFEVYRKYFEKASGGQPIKHFATASRLYAYLLDDPDPSLQGLDDRCHKDYAALLIPRAVGYSAALLDYFFRGKIEMITDTTSSGQYVINNESDEDMSGTFRLYYDNDQGVRGKVSGAEWQLNVAANSESRPVAFTAPTDAKEPGKYMLIFQGEHGAEAGAVVGRVVDLEIGEKYGLGGLIADGGSLNGYLVRLRFKTSQTERMYSKFFEEPRFIRRPDGTYYTELLSAGRSNRFNLKQSALAFLTTSPGVYESKIRVFDIVNGETVKLYEKKEILQDPEPEAPEAPSSPAFCGEVPGDWGTFEGWAKGYQIKDVFWRGEFDPIIYYTVSYIGGHTYWSSNGSGCEGIQYSIVKHFIDDTFVKTDSVITRSSRDEDTDWNGVIVPAQRQKFGTLSTFLSINDLGNLMLESKDVVDSYKIDSYYRIYPANNKYSYLKLGNYHYSQYGYETDCNEGTSFSDLLENGESSGSSFILRGEGRDVIKVTFTKQSYYYSYLNLIFFIGVNNGPLTSLTLSFPNNGYSFLDLNPVSIGYLKSEKLID